VTEGAVRNVQIGPTRSPARSRTTRRSPPPGGGDKDLLPKLLQDNNVQYSGKAQEEPNMLLWMLAQSLPFLLILGVAFFALRQVQKGGGSGAMGFGKSRPSC
jgi:cell division protease FtsH